MVRNKDRKAGRNAGRKDRKYAGRAATLSAWPRAAPGQPGRFIWHEVGWADTYWSISALVFQP